MAVLSKLLKTAAKKGKDVVDEIPVEKEIIPVAPVNQANLEKLGLDYKPGGEYVNPKTKEILTNKNVGGANIKVRPDMEIKGGRPQATMSVTDLDMPTIGSKGTDIKVNLVKPTKTGKKAGWNWTSRVDENMDANTLVSVTNKGKHYYTLETDFSRGANLRTYPNNKDEPRLRPTVSGNLELGNPVGTISLRGKEHPVYDKITTYNEGGAVMKKQMEMFQEGGLEQDGGTVDPVSGNKVPVGSSQEEVRDDIDAKLSEGEFVFPADVVRYIGLEKLMQLRQEAKAGLKKMEAMGQMGNSEEATLPDDIPFSPEDITVEDDDGNEGELEMNVGGVVYQPSQVGSQFNIAPRQQDPSGAMGYSYVPPVQQTGYLPSFGMQSQQPQQYTGFQSLVPMPTQKFENVSYINKTTGETMVIPHVGGNPVFQPPEGYVPITAGEEAPKEETKVDETIETSVPTATVTKPYDKEGDSTSPENMRKAEEERNRSYENMVESAIKQSGISNPSLEDVTKFIKDGNVKANLFGFEFGIPGLTFREEDIEKAYKKKIGLAEDTATGKFSGSDQIDRVGPDLKTTFTSAFKKKEDEDKDADATEELKETLSKLDATYKRQQEIDKEKADALFAQQEAAAKKYLQQLENKRAEAEENRKKAREEAIAAKAEQRDRAIRESEDRFVRETGMRRAKGGIASKPKKKTMKRGGLASKK